MIVVENIYKRYQLGNTYVDALNNISLMIKKRDFVCIAGTSGSGKSTLLNVVGCLDKQDSGSLFINDTRIDTIKESKLFRVRRKYIGFVFQSYNLIPVLSAYENVEYPLVLSQVPDKKRKEMVEQALHEVGLYERRNQKPREMSGGQQQRVAIARAISKRPPIILADEPTANLDSRTGAAIIELMKRINENDDTTFVFSTHDHEVMNASNKIFHIKNGSLVL